MSHKTLKITLKLTLTRLKLTNNAAVSYDIKLARKNQTNATKILQITLEIRAKNINKNYISK